MDDVVLERVAPADLVIRGGDGRTVYGLAVPFDREATVIDRGGPAYREVFRNGAFAKTIREGAAERVKFYVNHGHRQGKAPIGRAMSLREESTGLVGEFRISNTRDGDEALELVRDGVLDSFSVGFAKVKHRTDKTGLVERSEVKLHEVSLVAHPAYEGAYIAGVRAEELDDYSVEELERFAALAHDLATRHEEAGSATSHVEPAETTDEPVVGHSRGSQKDHLRIHSAIIDRNQKWHELTTSAVVWPSSKKS